MRFLKKFSFVIIFLFLASSAHAYENYGNGYLTEQEIQRVKDFKELLGAIDKKTLQETIIELERSKNPQINLEMKEAMAKTYIDLVKEFNVEGLKKKEWLYSMINLNMAYLQFGGEQGAFGSTTELNRLIRQKIKGYLPSNVLKQTGALYSL